MIVKMYEWSILIGVSVAVAAVLTKYPQFLMS